MPTLRTPVTLVTCLALSLPVTAAVASAAETAPAEPTATTTTTVSATDSLDWGRCRNRALSLSGARCATLRVPMDRTDPSGPTVSLALSRIRHTSSEADYRGVMLLNPGGPGGAGLTMSLVNESLPSRVSRRYDWIGFDPRGVGASRPRVTCDSDYFGFDRPNYFPRPQRILDKWLRRSENYADDCRRNGAILDHIRTTDSVADMESIRMALGVETINYFGFSYGTYLGQVYATQHPERVDRMIFDSNVDPEGVFYQVNLDQDIAMQKVLNKWFSWIADKHNTYRLGKTRKAVTKRYLQIENALDDKPAKGKVGPSEWTDIFNQVTYSESFWSPMASLFSNYARRKNGGALVQAYKGTVGFGDDNGFAVYLAVQCTDAPWPTAWSTWSRDNWATYQKAPQVAWMNAWFNAPCRTWPASPGPRVDVDGTAVPPILLVSGTHDGATPFSGSLTVRRLFPRSALVEIKGGATHADSLGNSCTRNWITRYLSSGDLPTRKKGNRADATCRSTSRPTSVSSSRHEFPKFIGPRQPRL